METYHKIMTLFKRDMDGSITGKKGKMLPGEWSTPELGYLANLEWEFTEKVDGTNIRISYDPFVHPDDQITIGGRTDNAVIPNPLVEYLTKTFFAKDFDSMFNKDHSIPIRVMLFGEGYGPKIQGGGKYLDHTSFVLFDVKIGDFWLDRANVDDIANKLGIKSVPVIGQGTLQDAIDIVSSGQKVYDWDGGTASVDGMVSKWGLFEAEGIVARPVVPLFNRKGERIICKIKGVDFK